MVTLGGSCVNSMQCPASAICSNAICSCPPGMVNNGGTCQQKGKLTLFCDSEENKKIEVDLECNATQVLVSGQCLNRAEIGQSCQATAQCNGGSSCASSICSCAAGQTIVNNVCTAGGNVCVCAPDYVTRFRNWKHYNMSDQADKFPTSKREQPMSASAHRTFRAFVPRATAVSSVKLLSRICAAAPLFHQTPTVRSVFLLSI